MTKKLLSAAITAVAAITLMTATVFAAPSVSDTQEVISSDSTSEVTVNGKTVTVNDAVASGDIKLVFSSATEAELNKVGVQSSTINDILSINGGDLDKLTSVLNSAVAKTADAKIDTKSLSLLANIRDLSYKTNSGEIVKDVKNVSVTWKAPLTSGMTVDNGGSSRTSIELGYGGSAGTSIILKERTSISTLFPSCFLIPAIYSI